MYINALLFANFGRVSVKAFPVFKSETLKAAGKPTFAELQTSDKYTGRGSYLIGKFGAIRGLICQILGYFMTVIPVSLVVYSFSECGSFGHLLLCHWWDSSHFIDCILLVGVAESAEPTRKDGKIRTDYLEGYLL